MAKSNKKLNIKKRNIYLDNASATKIDNSILKKMNKVYLNYFANPSGIHDKNKEAKKLLENARGNIAKILNTAKDEIIFTNSATEANNLAILGLLEKLNNKKILPHIIVSNIEHSSILEVCKYLEKNKKAKITYLKVEKNGIIDIAKIRKEVKSNTILISINYANNEIGTIQMIDKIAKEIRYIRKNKKNVFNNNFPLFHSDIVQAVNYLPINLQKLGVDMAVLNGNKIYGPRGIAILYKKRSVEIDSIIKGGSQEFGIRPSTENLPSIIGLSLALENVEKIKEKENKRLIILRDYFINKLEKICNKNKINFRLNGDHKQRLANNINISIGKIPSTLILIELSNYGIYISEKSACKSNDKKNSYVIEALYGKKEENLYSLRFSLGKDTKKEDLDYVICILNNVFKKLKKWYY